MKIVFNLVVVFCFVISFSSCSEDENKDQFTDTSVSVIPESKPIEIEVLELINAHRISIGLNTLEENKQVKGQAFYHTSYMVETKEVNHNNFFSRINYLKNNEDAIKVSENVAYGYSKAAYVVKAWLRSDNHRGSIEGDYTHFEISAEKGENGKWYFTNIFIKK